MFPPLTKEEREAIRRREIARSIEPKPTPKKPARCALVRLGARIARESTAEPDLCPMPVGEGMIGS